LGKAYVVSSYPKGTALIGDRRAGFINSIWENNEKAQKERLRGTWGTAIYIWSRRVGSSRIN